LGEVFESVGEGEAAETLFELSDNAADLSERLSAVTEESLQGRNKQELEHLVTTVANGLRIYEDIGSPSLWEAVQYEVSEENIEEASGVFVPKNLGPILHNWHAGMGDPIYKVGSLAFAGKEVPADLVADAIDNLEAEIDDASAKDKRELKMLVSALKKALR